MWRARWALLLVACSGPTLNEVERGFSKRGAAETGLFYEPTVTPAISQTAVTNLAANGALSWWLNYAVTPGAAGSDSAITDPGPAFTVPTGTVFVPEFYTSAHVNSTEIGFAQPYANTAGWVITFNEPYGTPNTTTDQAIAVWPSIQNMGVKIVAPSIGWGAPTAQNWWIDFVSKITANGYHFDAINFHGVTGVRTGNGNPIGLAQAVITQLDAFHAAYPTYEVWATELELLTTNDASGQAEINAFYSVIVPAMEQRPWVTHYACWPMTLDPNSGSPTTTKLSICDTSGALTATGTLYTSYSPHR